MASDRTPTTSSRAARNGLAFTLLALAFLACSGQRDVRGTYDVELRVPRIGVALHGTLVLGSRSLEIDDPAWVIPNKRGGGEIEDEDDLLLDANSCLVLESARTGSPHSVMLFEARARPDGIDLPFAFFDNRHERIEVTDLSLFAKALSGDLVYSDAEGSGQGRLYGDRMGDPDGDYCVLTLASFVEALAEEARRDAEGRDDRADERTR